MDDNNKKKSAENERRKRETPEEQEEKAGTEKTEKDKDEGVDDENEKVWSPRDFHKKASDFIKDNFDKYTTKKKPKTKDGK